MSMEAWRRAKGALAEATDYLSLIGRTTRYSTLASTQGEAATAGKLHGVDVKTTIHFQPSDGATNYHNCKAFDTALSKAIRSHWKELSQEAIAAMQADERAAASAARVSVEQMLADINAADAALSPAPVMAAVKQGDS